MEYDGECLKTLEGHSDGVDAVAILGPDRIVNRIMGQYRREWNTDGECLKTLKATDEVFL